MKLAQRIQLLWQTLKGPRKNSLSIILSKHYAGQPPSELLAQADFSWHKTVKLVGNGLDTLEPEFEVHHLTGDQLVVR